MRPVKQAQQDAEKGGGVAGTIPVLAQRAASEGPRWTRAVGIIPPTPYKVTARCGLAERAFLSILLEQGLLVKGSVWRCVVELMSQRMGT
jgi:hypothetical protein